MVELGLRWRSDDSGVASLSRNSRAANSTPATCRSYTSALCWRRGYVASEPCRDRPHTVARRPRRPLYQCHIWRTRMPRIVAVHSAAPPTRTAPRATDSATLAAGNRALVVSSRASRAISTAAWHDLHYGADVRLVRGWVGRSGVACCTPRRLCCACRWRHRRGPTVHRSWMPHAAALQRDGRRRGELAARWLRREEPSLPRWRPGDSMRAD